MHHPDWCTGGVPVHFDPKTLNNPQTHGVLKSWEEICVSASSRRLNSLGVLQAKRREVKRRGVFWSLGVQRNNCNEKYQKHSIRSDQIKEMQQLQRKVSKTLDQIRSDQRDATIAIRLVQRMNC
jgi:hypothetical protein